MNDQPDTLVGDPLLPDAFQTAKIALATQGRGVQRWLAALAAIVAAQHDTQPEGLEINVNGVVINVTYARFEPDNDPRDLLIP